MTGGRPPQWFHFGPWVFSIDAAEALIAATPRDTQSLDVTAWATAYDLTHLDDHHLTTINLIGPTRDAVDRTYAMATDLTQPVIIGYLSINDGPPAALLIDGVHPLYRAWRRRSTAAGTSPHRRGNAPRPARRAPRPGRRDYASALRPASPHPAPDRLQPAVPGHCSSGEPMSYTPAWQQSCNCRCPLHHGLPRITYDDPGCRCTITCSSQPIALLADLWGCALFLDQYGSLWQVPDLSNGSWDWENAGEIDSRSEFYDASVSIEHLLRLAVHVLGTNSR